MPILNCPFCWAFWGRAVPGAAPLGLVEGNQEQTKQTLPSLTAVWSSDFAGTLHPVQCLSLQEWIREKRQIKQSPEVIPKAILRRLNDHMDRKGLQSQLKLGGNKIYASHSWNLIVLKCFFVFCFFLKKKISQNIPWMIFAPLQCLCCRVETFLLSSDGCAEFCLCASD